ILFLFVSTAKGALFALPQFVAQAAILVSIYRCARRLGSPVAAAACAAATFATFAVVAEEGTTSQNDLAPASLPLATIAPLLETTTATGVLAGVALALGLGVKLTTALVLPIALGLTLQRGRRRSLLVAAGAAAGFVALSIWGFVLNVAHTGHLLGHGGGRTEV